MCQESVKGVSRKFPKSFKEVTRVFHESYFKKVSRAFQEKLKGVSIEFSIGFNAI